MKTEHTYITRILLVLAGFLPVSLLLFSGCEKEAPASLYVAPDPNVPTPTITGFSPPGEALAGVSLVTITGTNFSADPGSDLVAFNGIVAPVLQASTTQLVVRAPVVIADTVYVKVAVRGASDKFSSIVLYKLGPAVASFGGLTVTEVPYGLATDTAGNVYASLTGGGVGTGVTRFDPTGVRTAYSPRPSPSFNTYTGMKIGWGGALYVAAHKTAILRTPPGGGTTAIWLSSGLQNIDDLDFDQNGNAWCAGKAATGFNTSVFRVTSTKAVRAFPFRANVRSVRVYNNYLYLSGVRDSTEAVWRLPLVGDTLGTEEVYFNLTAYYGGIAHQANCITFSNDGNMFLATDGSDGILIVDLARTGAPYYPGLLSSPIVSLAWGKGAYLYASLSSPASTPTLLKINTEKTGAPYYGASLP